jgi:hypothetical protein
VRTAEGGLRRASEGLDPARLAAMTSKKPNERKERTGGLESEKRADRADVSAPAHNRGGPKRAPDPATRQPNRDRRGTERDESSRAKAEDSDRDTLPEIVTVPGHGPDDRDAGSATKEHLETHGLEEAATDDEQR